MRAVCVSRHNFRCERASRVSVYVYMRVCVPQRFVYKRQSNLDGGYMSYVLLICLYCAESLCNEPRAPFSVRHIHECLGHLDDCILCLMKTRRAFALNFQNIKLESTTAQKKEAETLLIKPLSTHTHANR